MSVQLGQKLPTEKRRYRHDWAPFLGEDSLADQTTTSADVTITADAIDGTAVNFTVDGGDVGTVATITQTITTATGDEETETFYLRIEADEPVSIGEVKSYLGLFADDWDAKIQAMIPRARLWVEDYVGLALKQREFTELRRTEHGGIRLFKGPLVDVSSVGYGDAQTYTPVFTAPDTLLRAATDDAWPTLDEGEAFEITYTAGFAEGQVDERLIGAMLALIEGEFSEGYAYPPRATESAERCCSFLRQMVA